MKKLITAMACLVGIAASAATEKTPNIAAKVSEDFKLGGSSNIFFYSTGDDYLNAAAMCKGEECHPQDGSLGKNAPVKNPKSGYQYVSVSSQKHTLNKGDLITLLYTVGLKASVYKRVYELNPSADEKAPGGMELTLKDEAYVSEMSVQPSQPASQPAPAVAQPTTYQQPVYQTLQSIAQARANALAQNNFLTHSIPGAPPKPSNVFEGVGQSMDGNPPTCVGPGSVVADAMARSASGWTYRVRFYQ